MLSKLIFHVTVPDIILTHKTT